VVGNRDWNRIEAELGATLLGNRDHAQQPANQRRKDPKSKIDAESVLKQIKEALQQDDDLI